jgi:hypothetical protein
MILYLYELMFINYGNKMLDKDGKGWIKEKVKEI